ncbi:hypothetical protein AB0M36_14710 [Actinoplanes sp. NPDC051346]|uniref:hypothetical protein n=1 Tax=Actinoplanes sp. NPDC051346 TaxID=3155048 RepID=UPI0034462F49
MLQAVAPRTGPFAAEHVTTLAITRMVSMTFPVGRTRLDDDVSLDFMPDVARAAGVGFRPEVIRRPGNTFAAMTEALVPELGTLAGGVDLALLAHVTPDAVPSEVAGPVITAALPGEPSSFAVTDNGLSAPYTALALAQRYARRCGFHRIVLFLFDQASSPFDIEASPVQRVDGDAAVALVLERPGPGDAGGFEVRQESGVAANDVAARLTESWRELSAGTPALFLGPGVDADWAPPVDAARVHHLAAGFPGTGVWRALGDHWNRSESQTAVLMDYDPACGDLSVCRVHRGHPAA